MAASAMTIEPLAGLFFLGQSTFVEGGPPAGIKAQVGDRAGGDRCGLPRRLQGESHPVQNRGGALFRRAPAAEIRPLTFLVGENSTGKTTALACFQVLADFLNNAEVDFNRPPYLMGIFNEIVRRSRKADKTFSLGLVFEDHEGSVGLTAGFGEKEGGFEPFVRSAAVQIDDLEILFEYRDSPKGEREQTRYHVENGGFRVTMDARFAGDLQPFHMLDILALRETQRQPEAKRALAAYLEKTHWMGRKLPGWGMPGELAVFSSSPVRSNPKRTYDPIRESGDPEGSDVPMRLMRVAGTRPEMWKRIQRELVAFGKSSGLFEKIDVKNLGHAAGAPFQLKVKVRGPTANVVDVGYGVSQVLPILELILNDPFSRRADSAARRSIYLLQQPEVHLHPRAQAELSSLLGRLASRGNQSFIVETHSDYLIAPTLANLKGEVVVIEAFQMLCPGCVSHGIPQAQRIQQNFGEEVTLLGLHTVFEHHAAMTPVSLEAFLHEYGIAFPVGVDEHRPGSPTPVTMGRYRLRGTPSLVIVDRAGNLRVNAFGQVDDLPLGAALARLIDQPRPEPGPEGDA